MKHKSILCITCLWIFIFCHAHSGKLFTTDRELSSSLINKIYQDRNGMIWVATEDGLNRYDGAKFTTYKHEQGNVNSLSHNYVRALFEDNQGHLYVGTINGVQMYDAAADCFSPRAEWENGEIYDKSVNSIMQKKSGEVMVAGNVSCIINITPEGKLIVKKLSLPIPGIMTQDFFEDDAGNLWIIVNEEGVYRQSADNQCKHYLKQEGGAPIISMCQDEQGYIYAASTGHGLFKYDEKTDSFTSIPYNGQHNLLLRSLYLGKEGEILMGTDGEGLKIYNAQTNEITDGRFENSYFDLSKSKIHSILKDHSGNFWLAIYQKGIMMIPDLPYNFKYIGPKSFDKDIIGSYAITALCRDHKGILWVGTDNDGVYGITDNGKQKVHYSHTQNPASISSIIIKLYEDSEHNLWFGSYMNGMGKLDRKTGHCTYLTDLRDSGGKRVQRVYCFAEDANKRLWIATMGAGLFYYDLKTDKIHPCRLKSDVKVSDWICSLLYSDKDNKLYIGTYDGLFRLDLNSTELKPESILSYSIIHSIFEDNRGTVWLATSEGLSGWNKETQKITTYTAKDGLPSDVIFAIQDSKQDHLWISTDAGISQFNLETQEFINYYVGDGRLQGNEFSKNTSFKDENGILWFGGVNGITYFNPEDIIKPSKKWNVRITDFYLHNKPVRKGMKSGRHEIIDRPVFDAEIFRLSHKDNAFSIEFATKEPNSPERISYMYSMDEANWVTLRNGINRISFNDLSPGTHRFRIRAKDYTLLSDIKEITIVISPARYASIWAKLCYVLLFALALYLIISQIRHRYRMRQEMLEHKHAEEINEAKLQFFMNISHEIRTPISLIISPLQKLMASDDDPKERKRSYRTISCNSERILQLVNQLMDIRKIDKGQILLKFSEIDIVDFIKDLYQTYQYQTKAKHIELTFSTEYDVLDAWVDPKNFDKIILNLLSNACKFTPEGGKIEILLRTGSDATEPEALRNYVEIVVSDTGIGINESERSHIFDRFYQIRNSQNNSNVGTGIGLHLTRSLVELHYGTIRVESNPEGAGSCFIVRLPLGKEHLKPDEIETEVAYNMLSAVEEPTLVLPIAENDNTKLKSKSKYRVLVVEDDEEIRKYICRELSGDFHILESTNGKEALSMILKKAPNLVISDVMMPEMDGLTLCRKIKQNVNINHVPVILLTAKTHEEDNLEGLSIGADAYMTKPFNIDILKKTAENIIKSRELLRNCFTGSQKPIFELQSTDNKLLERIMNVINRNLSNPELNVAMISSEVGISRVHLYRKLKELTNQSARDLIRNVRLKHAASLLVYKHYNVTEVASLTGFTSTSLFSRVFKELYGVSPKDYIAQHAPTGEEPEPNSRGTLLPPVGDFSFFQEE